MIYIIYIIYVNKHKGTQVKILVKLCLQKPCNDKRKA